MELRYQLAVVTGGAAGLGRELCVGLSRAGCAVLVVDRDRAGAEETVALVERARVKAWALQADLTDDLDRQLVAARARDLGGADLLVTSAGGWTEGDHHRTAPGPDASRSLDLDLRTPVRLTQLFLADLDARRGRRDGVPGVVNVASSAGAGTAGHASPEYAAAKAGLVRFTTAMAAHADRVRVMAVVPGRIGLERAQAERAGLPPPARAAAGEPAPPADVVRTVIDLLARGRAGEVVDLLEPPRPHGT